MLLLFLLSSNLVFYVFFLVGFDLDGTNMEKGRMKGRAFFQGEKTGDVLEIHRIIGLDWWINATATATAGGSFPFLNVRWVFVPEEYSEREGSVCVLLLLNFLQFLSFALVVMRRDVDAGLSSELI